MEKAFPFNAEFRDGEPDRVYTAEDFAAERAAYVSNGVTAEGGLAVSPSAAGGLAVDVAAGIAVIDGYTYFNTSPLTLHCAEADASLSRIDLAVLRLDLDARTMYCALKPGTPAPTPAAPEAETGDTVRELALAEIRVAAGASTVTAEDIADRRVRADYILNRVDVQALLASYEAALEAYFGTDDASALAAAAAVVRTDAGAGRVLCGDGAYRSAVLDGYRYTELARFTASGTFQPSLYPTRDGLYDVIIQGAGGSGAYGSTDNQSRGGEAGGMLVLSGLPLRSGASYPVTVGAGGEPRRDTPASDGRAGGDSSFAGFTACGGRGGKYGPTDLTPLERNGFTPQLGTTGTGGSGGASLFAAGGANNYSGSGAAGSLGSGGGAGYSLSDLTTVTGGRGGDGVVIVRGAAPLG